MFVNKNLQNVLKMPYMDHSVRSGIIYVVIDTRNMTNYDLDGTEAMEIHMNITEKFNQLLKSVDQNILWMDMVFHMVEDTVDTVKFFTKNSKNENLTKFKHFILFDSLALLMLMKIILILLNSVYCLFPQIKCT